jgi:chaperonin cofactor prefoldin
MRLATFSTENPPQPLTCVETAEYINALRRRIEVQNDSMEHLANQVQTLRAEIQRLTTQQNPS